MRPAFTEPFNGSGPFLRIVARFGYRSTTPDSGRLGSVPKGARFAVIAEMMIGAGAATVGGVAYTRRRRARLYRELADRVAWITNNHALDMGSAQRRSLPDFADRLAILPDFLPPHTFAALLAEAERLANPERNYVPVHKKEPGDHIGWHYDHNFYRGRHFTLLLTIVNTGRAAHGLSHAVLQARVGGGEIGIAPPRIRSSSLKAHWFTIR
jgi:hypothetical protein